ncbi:hypothetical protein SLEP1_g3692 [Rubroshorea leprosula]|uniref:Uncharacterized protein n=1 Tax=Rubroshorea leprosula TaxID=152421 RepID=A0AAV5HLR2_9ROSI|nr:hypothetical protein SLEP1_g3692 [Rubroshorea leprosula]
MIMRTYEWCAKLTINITDTERPWKLGKHLEQGLIQRLSYEK